MEEVEGNLEMASYKGLSNSVISREANFELKFAKQFWLSLCKLNLSLFFDWILVFTFYNGHNEQGSHDDSKNNRCDYVRQCARR